MDAGGASGDRPAADAERGLYAVPPSNDDGSSGPPPAGSVIAELRAANAFLEASQRVARFGSWQWSLEDDSVTWSSGLYLIFGIGPSDSAYKRRVTFTTYLERVHPDERDLVQSSIERSLSKATSFAFEHRIVLPNGDERWVRCHGEPTIDAVSGRVQRVLGACQELESPEGESERPQSLQAKGETPLDRFRSAFENAPIGIALVDFSPGPDGVITEVNRSLSDIVGMAAADLIGLPMSALAGDDDEASDVPLRERLAAGEIDGYTIEKRAASEEREIWLQLSVSAVPGGELGDGGGIVQVQDVTERKRFEEQLRYIADHDSLTGLTNRRRFREELDQHIALRRRYGGYGAVLLIDVDRLKSVNDNRGHGAGDVVLKQVAETMTGRVRSTDIVARLAGDEFAVLLPSAEPDMAQSIGEDLIARVAQNQVAAWGVSISVGVALFGEEDTRSAEEVMATADAAMYRAKQAGGSRAELAAGAVDPDDEESVLRAVPDSKLSLADRVRRALESDSLMLYGQPVVDLRTGHIAHHELLVRMKDEETGDVLAASDFLAAATQEPGLCAAVDLWVAEKAIESLTGPTPWARYHLNLSGETIARPESVDALIDLVVRSEIDPASLGFEVSEASILRDPEGAQVALEALASCGSPLVLDGFSAAFGSFEFIQRLPVHQVKIDGAVVRRLLAEDSDSATLRAIVRLAHGTSKTTVAKLVEATNTIPLLKMHGIDMAQGFEFGEPVPLADVA